MAKKKKKAKKKKSKKPAIAKATVVPPKTLKEEYMEEQVKKPKGQTEKEKYDLEREIRRYVRKLGGYRKDLPQAKRELCGKLLAKREGPLRNKVERDLDMLIPGLDKPTVANIVQKKS